MNILERPAPDADARVLYGSGPQQFGDVRIPSGAGPHPVVLWVHGGFWRNRYDLTHAGHACDALTQIGIATWNIEYRRIGDPGGGWPGTFVDVAAAADFLPDLARQYPLDLTRCVVGGHSAGGHLALWLAGRDRIPGASTLRAAAPFRFAGVVSVAGVCDLHEGWRLGLSGAVVQDLMGGTPHDQPDRFAAGDPMALLPLGVPQILVHGTDDANVPFEISEQFARHARNVGDRVEVVALPDTGHFEPIDPSTEQWHATERAIDSLIGGTAR